MLKIELDCPHPKGTIIKEVIRGAASVLDIAGYSETIKVTLIPMPRTDGLTNVRLRPIHMVLNNELKAVQLISTICHEMFHVRDILLGNLVIRGDEHFYKGVLIPKEDLRLASLLHDRRLSAALLPDEAVAYAGQQPLAALVVSRFSDELQELIADDVTPEEMLQAVLAASKKMDPRLALASFKKARPNGLDGKMLDALKTVVEGKSS